MTTHHLDTSKLHNFWDNTIPPRIHIKPGDTVVFETVEASVNQIAPDSTDADIGRLDFGRVNAVTGPVFMDGAEPGDGLVVEVLNLKHKGWGWNAVIPNFGLLGEEFPEPYIQHYKLGETSCNPTLAPTGNRRFFFLNYYVPHPPLSPCAAPATQPPPRQALRDGSGSCDQPRRRRAGASRGANTSHLRTFSWKGSQRIKQLDKIQKLLIWLKGHRRRHVALLGFVLIVDLLDLPTVDAQATGGQDVLGHLVPQARA